jgi:hypothetical protein
MMMIAHLVRVLLVDPILKVFAGDLVTFADAVRRDLDEILEFRLSC